MEKKLEDILKTKKKNDPRVGQGFNDSRGEIPDQEDIPKHNGLNVNNDPNHVHENQKQTARR